MARTTRTEFVSIIGTDLAVVVYANPTSSRSEYTLTAQVLEQPKGRGTTILADNIKVGTVKKDVSLPTSREWVSTVSVPGSVAAKTANDGALGSALYSVGRIVGADYVGD
jgi:hypothetical protein